MRFSAPWILALAMLFVKMSAGLACEISDDRGASLNVPLFDEVQGLKKELLKSGLGPEKYEVFLQVSYELHCKNSTMVVPAYVKFQGRRVRVDLIESQKSREISLGNLSEPVNGDVALEVEPHPDCVIESINPRFTSLEVNPGSEKSVQKLAMMYSPFIVSRPDQVSNHSTDLPLSMTWTESKDKAENRVLQYTVYFSDEDVATSALAAQSKFARYGRHGDIEAAYRITLDSTGGVSKREYLSGVLGGIGQKWKEFRGDLLPGTQHAVLYNEPRIKQNVFNDVAMGKQKTLPTEGHALVPRVKLDAPAGREALYYGVGDRGSDNQNANERVTMMELLREDKLPLAPSHYLVVQVDGELKSGSFNIVLERGENTRLHVTDDPILKTEAKIDRIGEDHHGHQTWAGIPWGAEYVRNIGVSEEEVSSPPHGKITFEKGGLFKPQLSVEKLRFFRWVPTGKTYRVEEITDSFKCNLDGLKSQCEF